MSAQLVTSTVPAGAVVQWGFITVTVANLIVILTMIVVFVLAILLPFPVDRDEDRS